jgi:dipeptidyl aminopeptidase/acylaminoacyl peptidase
MRLFAGVALACALAPHAHAARPFTIEDQLSLQDFGRVAFSPDGRWLIAERYGRWKDAPSFDHEFLDQLTTSRLVVSDLRAGASPRALLVEDAKAGDTFGEFSPDGSRVLVFRLKDRRREMGVAALATGEVNWSGLTVDPEIWTAQARWRGDHQVVVIARAPQAPSMLLGSGWQTPAPPPAPWAAHGRGEYSGVMLGAGRYAGRNPPPASYDLALFDLATGAARVLAHGGFVDLLISPDRRMVALSQEAELTAPSDGGVIQFSYPPRRRRLVLVDLDSAAAVHPCPGCDLAQNTWAWSPDSQAVVAAVRDGQAFDAPYGYWRLDHEGSASALAPSLGVGLVSAGNMATPTGQVHWLGSDPAVLAQPVGGDRADWWRLTAKGPLKLTGSLAAPQGTALAADAQGLLIRTAAGLVRLPPQGPPRLLPPAGLQWQTSRALPGRSTGLLLAEVDGRGRLIATTGAQGPAAVAQKDAALKAFSSRGDVAAIVKDEHGVRTLMLYRPRARAQALVTINADLAEVQFSQPVAIKHLGKHGEALTSWLYLPPDHKAGDARPVIIVPYAGERYDRPPRQFEPGSVFPLTNVQLMVAKGYAVIAPSLPLTPGEDAAPGLADAILRIVDAAHAQYPGLSSNRLALWGQSFGGWSSLIAGAQSPRFKALIATAPATDLVTLHSSLRPVSLAVPEVGMSLSGMQGWAEGGQAHMGGPPWTALDRYVRNSPLFQADKITAPVMLVYGDMDFDTSQVTSMFMSLARQGKDVQLLYYRGENHLIVNPANVRDLHQRAFAFLADALGPASATGAASPSGSPLPPALEIRPSQ